MNLEVFEKLLGVYGFVVVLLWFGMHSTCWFVVEAYRLWRSTIIKLAKIRNDKEAEE